MFQKDRKVKKHVGEELIHESTGSFGKYHLYLSLLIFLSKLPTAFHLMAIIFLAPKVSYTCGESGKNTCPCSKPVYDTSVFTRTIIMEWNLICEKKWLVSFTQTIMQLGTLTGSVVFGMASDRFGRRKPFLVAVVLQLSAGVAAAYVRNYWVFTALRYIIGLSVGGAMVTGFVLIMEFCGKKYRDVVSVFFQIAFTLGHTMLPLFSYFFRDYSDFLIGLSAPVVLMLSYFCLLPESPRWLTAMRRTEQAVVLLERVAKVNKYPVDKVRANVEEYQAFIEKHNLKKGTLLDVFRTPNLRRNILAMAFNWLSCGYCYYGISQYVGQLSGDVFINVACSGFVTIVGTFFTIPLLKMVDRKISVVAFHLICVTCLVVLAIIPEGVGSVVCACIGVVASYIALAIVYLYCTELFPTVVRNAALGFSSMSARIGSMIAPFVVDLRAVALWVPPLVFAVLPLTAAFVVLLIPETRGSELTTTLDEGERFGQKRASTKI